jgi:hypothetical protein
MLLLRLLHEGSLRFDPGGFLGLLMVTGLFAYPTTFIVGIPAYVVYRKLKIRRLRSYIAGGFVSGLIFGAAIFGIPDSSLETSRFVAAATLWITIAIAASIETGFFWALVVRPQLRVTWSENDSGEG